MKSTMKKIGITGPIGAGKSFVCDLLRIRGFNVIDADSLVHELYRDSSELRKQIEKEFGSSLLTPSGIDRERAASLIFKDDCACKKLESLVYPYLTRAILDFFACEKCVLGFPIKAKFVEAALLSRVPLIVEELDEVWIVDAPENQRLERLLERGLSREDASLRIENQRNSFEESLFLGKKVVRIENGKSKSALSKKILELIDSL